MGLPSSSSLIITSLHQSLALLLSCTLHLPLRTPSSTATMRTTTFGRASCLCAPSLIIIVKHLLHILGIECLLHRSTIIHFHHQTSSHPFHLTFYQHLPSSSRLIGIKTPSLKNHLISNQGKCLPLVHWLFTPSHAMYRRFCSAINQLCLFTCAAHLSLRATSLIKTQPLRFSVAFSQVSCFSLLLAFSLTKAAILDYHTRLSHFNLHILPILPFHAFTSLHFIAQAAHDTFTTDNNIVSTTNSSTTHFLHQKVHQQHFFDNKLISNTFLRHQPFSHQQLDFCFFVLFLPSSHFDKNRGFGTIRVCTRQKASLDPSTDARQVHVRAQVFFGT